MILDRFVFSTETALTDAQLDALSDSGTQPPAPEPATYGAMLMGSVLGLLGFRRWKKKGAARK